MNATEATEAHEKLPYPVGKGEKARAAREEYHEQLSEISGQFRDWLAQEYASDLPVGVQSLIFGKAWESGHSSGYYEIQGHYQEYADFAREARKYE